MIIVGNFEFIFCKKNIKLLKPLKNIKHLLRMKTKQQKFLNRS